MALKSGLQTEEMALIRAAQDGDHAAFEQLVASRGHDKVAAGLGGLVATLAMGLKERADLLGVADLARQSAPGEGNRPRVVVSDPGHERPPGRLRREQ